MSKPTQMPMELDNNKETTPAKVSSRKSRDSTYDIIQNQDEEIAVLKKYIEFLENQIKNHLNTIAKNKCRAAVDEEV